MGFDFRPADFLFANKVGDIQISKIWISDDTILMAPGHATCPREGHALVELARLHLG